MKGEGLLIALGKPKSGKDEEDTEPVDSKAEENSEMDSALEEAFHAVKEDDMEGFKLALRNAIECCMSEAE